MVYYSLRRKVNNNSDIKAQNLKRMSPVQFDIQYQEQALYTYPREKEYVRENENQSLSSGAREPTFIKLI